MNSWDRTQCLVCGASLLSVLRNISDTRFGIADNYDVWQCVGCGLEQTFPVPSPKDLKNLYEIYYNFGGEKGTTYTSVRERFLASNLYRFWLAIDGDIAFHGVRGMGQLLDIGCNEGRGLRLYRHGGFDAEGLELNEMAATVARQAGFTVHVQPVEEFQPATLYDVVVLSNVLEHSPDPKGILVHVHRFLKPGGEVWISCPNNQSWWRSIFGRFWINWHVPFHIVHFSPQTLTQLLQDSRFNVSEIKQETPALWVAHSIIARLFAKHGRPTGQLRNSLLVAALMLFIRGFLFPLLWLGNRTGHGDCLVVVAKKV